MYPIAFCDSFAEFDITDPLGIQIKCIFLSQAIL